MTRPLNGFTEALEKEYEHHVCSAFSSGRSVMEIGRLTGQPRVQFIYKILQKRGFIGNSQRRSRCRGPAPLEKKLKRAGISFAQWCNCWSFDPEIAERALSSPDDFCTAEPIREAAARDFPKVFGRSGSPWPTGTDYWDGNGWENEDYSYHLDWDRELGMHIGTIPGVNSLRVSGVNPIELVTQLVRAAWLMKCIESLKAIKLKNHKPSEKDPVC